MCCNALLIVCRLSGRSNVLYAVSVNTTGGAFLNYSSRLCSRLCKFTQESENAARSFYNWNASVLDDISIQEFFLPFPLNLTVIHICNGNCT